MVILTDFGGRPQECRKTLAQGPAVSPLMAHLGRMQPAATFALAQIQPPGALLSLAGAGRHFICAAGPIHCGDQSPDNLEKKHARII